MINYQMHLVFMFFPCIFQDILENEDLHLDDMFIASLVFDLIKVFLKSFYTYITGRVGVGSGLIHKG